MSLRADRYIALDEEGYFAFDGRRVDDRTLGQTLMQNLRVVDKDRLVTSLDGQTAFVESFDAPLVARHIRLGSDGKAEIDVAYGMVARFDLSSLCVDEWDRFHGLSDEGLPFVFSRQAQVEFFDLLDSFDDDSVTIQGHSYAVGPWLVPNAAGNEDAFWSNIYRNEKPGWDLGAPSEVLPYVLPQLKLSKQRVLVLGAGGGHDAAFFAQAGHAVTAVDFSEEALGRAKSAYGSVENLKYVKADIFQLPDNMAGRFDLIFEHTCYCAVSPERRNELVSVWRRVLSAQGQMLGVFFANEKRDGPPWGGSEWELRERLKTHFEFLFWTRWRASIEVRKARELVIFARRR